MDNIWKLGLAHAALCKSATCMCQTCLSKTLFIPSIWPVSGLVIVKNKLTSVFYAPVPLLKINFVITLSKVATATLTMLWCNLSIRGQVHKKTDVNLSNRHSILCKKTCMKYMYYTLWIKSSLFFLLGEKLEGLSSVLHRFWSTCSQPKFESS